MRTGQTGYVVALRGGREFQQRVSGMGLHVGSNIEVTQQGAATGSKGPVVIDCGSKRLRIGHGMATKILVSNRVKIKDLKIGQRARIIGYVTQDRDYRHKLLRMGMIKQAEFKLVRVAPLGDPVVIELRGASLTLRKTEADALEIEVIDPS